MSKALSPPPALEQTAPAELPGAVPVPCGAEQGAATLGHTAPCRLWEQGEEVPAALPPSEQREARQENVISLAMQQKVIFFLSQGKASPV